MKHLAGLLCLFLLLGLLTGCSETQTEKEPDTATQQIGDSTDAATQPNDTSKKTMLLNTETIVVTPYGTNEYKMVYDKAGHLISSKTYSGETELSATTLTYDENGYQNSEIIISSGIETRDEWTNDAAGNKFTGTQTSISSFGNFVSTYEYQYSEGKAISYTMRNSSGETQEKRTWQYTDENGSYRLTVQMQGYQERIYSVSFNAQKQMTEETITVGGVETSRTKYDEHGNETEITSDGTTVTCKNTYENGLLTQIEQTDSDDELVRKTVYTYDTEGNILTTIITDGSGTQISNATCKYTSCVVEN